MSHPNSVLAASWSDPPWNPGFRETQDITETRVALRRTVLGLTPGLSLRFLVQCAPYDALMRESLNNLCDHFKTHQSPPNQYAILVHQTALYPHDKVRLLDACGGFVIVLHSDEIDLLPSVFQL